MAVTGGAVKPTAAGQQGHLGRLCPGEDRGKGKAAVVVVVGRAPQGQELPRTGLSLPLWSAASFEVCSGVWQYFCGLK